MDGGLFMSVAFDAVQLSDVYRTVRKICRTEYVATCRSVLGSYCLFNTDGPVPSYVASRGKSFVFGAQFYERLERNTESGRREVMKVKSKVKAGEGCGLDPFG